MDGRLVFLDQEKAYDRVRRVWLEKVLARIGVPGGLGRAIIRMLEGSKAAIMVNGHQGVPFSLGRGVPQGDPLSPILYALSLEPLLDRIRRRIEGLSVLGVTWKVGAFADDMVVGLGSVQDVGELKEMVGWYERCSGQKLNWHKCETMVLGNGIVGGDIIGTVVPAGEAVRYLGIFLSVYGSVLPKAWWEGKVQAWGDALKGWGGRHISLAGRVTILNVYWMPKLWYLAYHLDFPAWVVKRLLKLAKDWIWAGRRSQISWETLALPVERGGLGLVDFPA